MIIGIPKEIKNNENRVSMTPAGVRELVQRGHTVYVQHTAGINSGFADEEYVRHEIKTEDADICDNLGELNDNNDFRVEGAFNDIVYRLRRALSPENGLPVGDRLEYLSGIFGACTNAVFQIFCNFVEFLEYYF